MEYDIDNEEEFEDEAVEGDEVNDFQRGDVGVDEELQRPLPLHPRVDYTAMPEEEILDICETEDERY